MQKDVKFQLEEAVEIPNWCDAYPEHKFCVYKCCILSTAKNAHGLDIDEETLRKFAPTILGNFLTVKIENGDAMGHERDLETLGYFPVQQEIEFVKDENGIVKAYCFAVVSKRYGKKLNDIFEYDNLRNSSVEMTIQVEGDAETGKVESFDIYSLTVLNKSLDGSCPDADIKMVRFSKEDAEAYFAKTDSLSALKSFAEERKQAMAEKKTYKIDKSKEKLSEDDWSDIDKTELRNKIMDAKNRDELVKAVYLDVRDNWEEAPSEGLKFPVMQLKGDTFMYNRRALSSALTYAKANDEQAVVDKVEKIYKELGLDETERKEEAKMDKTKMAETEAKVEEKAEETKMDEIEGRKAWAEVIKKVQEHEGDGVYVDSIEDDHIIYTKDDVRYRVEADIKVDDDDKEIDADIKWDTVKKDADQKMAEEEKPAEMSIEDAKAEIDRLKAEIESRDNIIMEKDTELAGLRKYKEDIEAKEKAMAVEKILSDYRDYMTDEQCENFRKTGLECQMSEIDGWANKVKAVSFDALVASKKSKDNKSDVWRFSAPAQKNTKEIKSVWDKF